MFLMNCPTVKAQVYITGTGGVAHAYQPGVLCRWDEKNVNEGKDGGPDYVHGYLELYFSGPTVLVNFYSN